MSPEALAYFDQIVASLQPMTDEQIHVVAHLVRRIDARRQAHETRME